MIRVLIALLATLLLLPSPRAEAADVCPMLRLQLNSQVVANRIAAAACDENLLWHRPFIDADGRLASQRVTEGESAQLGDGTPTWQRVAAYWREAGLLGSVSMRPGAGECAYPYPHSPGCRSFIVDVPWSGAFISWLMRRAAVPGFPGSASHVDYVRAAFRNPSSHPYRPMPPTTTRPRVGDLLCYVRVPSRVFGWDALSRHLAVDNGGLPMHCDAVVAVNPGGDGLAYLIGGNVLDGVTMRLLKLDAGGTLGTLPMRTAADLACTADDQTSCGFNRQDWSVLLQLRTPQELAQLPPAIPLATSPRPPQPQQPQQPSNQECCVYCVAGGNVPRCPDAGAVRPRNPR